MRSVNARPCINDGEDLSRLQIGKSEIVRFGKGQDVAFAGDRLRSE